jgi:organic hydroperoxide reductase OsmC/OhrA
MVSFPLKFEVNATAKPGIRDKWHAKTGDLPPIECAIPLEFMGPGGGYSPEDLFAISLVNCLVATFKFYCEKAKLSFEEIAARAVLSVDRMAGEPGFTMTQADIFFDIKGASDVERVRKQLDAAIRDCAVSNSIKTGKTFHINIS